MNEQIDQMAQELEIPEFLKRTEGEVSQPVVDGGEVAGEFVQTDEEVPAEVLQ